MNSGRNHKRQYSSADIQRYLSGELSDAERHALEEQALEDLFLADALEGMELRMRADLLADDLRLLTTRLKARTEYTRKAVIAPFYKVAAAAIVFLLAGSLSIFYFMNKARESGPMTVAGEIQRKKSSTGPSDTLDLSGSPYPAAPKSDMVTMERKKEPASSSPGDVLQDNEPPVAPRTILPKQEETVTSAKNDNSLSRKAGSPLEELNTLRSENTEDISAGKSDTLNSRKQSVRAASMAMKKASPVAEHEGRSQSAAVVTSESMPVRKDAQKKVEVVGISRNDQSGRNLAVITPLSSDTTSFAPRGSWSALNSRMQTAFIGKSTRTETILQFRISPQGQASDLRILKADDQSPSAEIIGFLQNGPLWKLKAGTDSTVKLLIRF